MFVISRIEQYKFSDCAAVYAEAERKLARYDNPDWHPERVKDNVHLIYPLVDKSIEQHILDRKKEFKCRLSTDPNLPLNKQTNCYCQALFTASPEFFQGLSKQDSDQFFEHCLDFFSSYLPRSVEIISAVVHYDETTPHMHVSFLPSIAKRNSKGKMKTVFSSSDLFQGKDYFTQYQDAFFEHMQLRYPDIPFDRKGAEHQDHLSITEYKQVQAEIKKSKERLEEIDQIKQDALNDSTPLINAKIANADLRREKQLLEKENEKLKSSLRCYNSFVKFLLSKFPMLKPLIDAFYDRALPQNRGKFERDER